MNFQPRTLILMTVPGLELETWTGMFWGGCPAIASQPHNAEALGQPRAGGKRIFPRVQRCWWRRADHTHGTFKTRKNMRGLEAGRFEMTAVMLVCGSAVLTSRDALVGSNAATRVHVVRLVEPSTS
jgi:hypothetical protein